MAITRPYKRVDVTCRCNSDGQVLITVRDEGPGFRSDAVPDPTSPENRLSTHGRGIYLMRMLMDEVSFVKGGSVVRMRKKSNPGNATQRTERNDEQRKYRALDSLTKRDRGENNVERVN